jgi:hypothetical protein
MKMKYYIAIVNPNLHMAAWKTIKTNLNVLGYSYVVYFDVNNKILEFNEVSKEVFTEMQYSEN